MKKDNDNNTKEQEDIWIAKKKVQRLFFFLFGHGRKEVVFLDFLLIGLSASLAGRSDGVIFQGLGLGLGIKHFPKPFGVFRVSLGHDWGLVLVNVEVDLGTLGGRAGKPNKKRSGDGKRKTSEEHDVIGEQRVCVVIPVSAMVVASGKKKVSGEKKISQKVLVVDSVLTSAGPTKIFIWDVCQNCKLSPSFPSYTTNKRPPSTLP